MTDDAKEWVTVKVEKPVRDDAQDDPRTYTEIMRAGLEETPTPEGHIPEGVVRSAVCDALDGVDPTPATNGVELGDLREQLDRIESAASTAEERTGSIQNTLENMGGR